MSTVLMRCTAESARVFVQDDFQMLVQIPDSPSVQASRTPDGTGVQFMTEFPREVTPEVLEDLKYLAVHRLPTRAKPFLRGDYIIGPGESLETGTVNDSGDPLLWCVGSDEIPEDTMAVAEEVRLFGNALINRVFRLLVWRYFPKGSTDPNRSCDQCSVDGGITWFSLPRNIKIVMTLEKGIPRDADGYEVSRLAHQWQDAPTGYSLLWEARSLSSTNARLALTITALEVGTKEFITRCEPATDWLLENLQSPPVFKLLRDYLPLLKPIVPGYERYNSPPSEALTAINRGIQARNALLHRGESFTAREMEELDRAVHSVLMLLDRYSGETWALHST